MKGRKRLLLWLMLSGFILVNVIAAFHAYTFTHFNPDVLARTRDDPSMSPLEKADILLTGVDLPRPQNTALPARPYVNVQVPCERLTAGWLMMPGEPGGPVKPKGTVIIFHGYGGTKSSMLDKADAFLAMGYSTLLIDFIGSGESEGNQTTVGYLEAEQVRSCFDYMKLNGEKNIYLFGTSMGAAAILKALHDYPITPAGIILECPFGSLYETTCARFRSLGIPVFPMAELLVFWGGLENGFWGFDHKPEIYASAVMCPALLMYGEQDEKVSRKEIDTIFSRMRGKKTLLTFPHAGHENYLRKHRVEWVEGVSQFLPANVNK